MPNGRRDLIRHLKVKPIPTPNVYVYLPCKDILEDKEFLSRRKKQRTRRIMRRKRMGGL